MTEVVIYTDGACSGNPGPGGWGVVLRWNGTEKELHGGDPQTTNNRMELTAAIQALEALKRPARVHLHTDSKYVLDGITKWIVSWQRNGWRTAAKKPVKNEDLWRRLVAAMNGHEISWLWVKGHAGDEGNERADELARLGSEEAALSRSGGRLLAALSLNRLPHQQGGAIRESSGCGERKVQDRPHSACNQPTTGSHQEAA